MIIIIGGYFASTSYCVADVTFLGQVFVLRFLFKLHFLLLFCFVIVILQDVVSGDAGTYFCEALNGVGSNQRCSAEELTTGWLVEFHQDILGYFFVLAANFKV